MTPKEPLAGNELANAISDAVTRLHTRYYGKEPRGAKTYLDEDFVFCVLREPFTTVEQTLIEMGQQKEVREARQSFQDAMDRKFKQTIEELADRRVSSFMSQIQVGPDLAIEVFKFEEPEEQLGFEDEGFKR